MKKTEIKYLVIAHDILTEISDTEIYEAIGSDISTNEIEIMRFPDRLEFGNTQGFGWQERKTKQSDFFLQHIGPKLDFYKEAELMYFGLAPIPLAIHLGYLVSGLRKVRVFQKHHDEKNWKWQLVNTSTDIVTQNVPREFIKASGEIVLTCSSSYPVHSELIDEIVSEPLKVVEIGTSQTHRDIFESEELLKKYASAFRDVIDAITNSMPEINGIHLFSAIPNGLAFLLGQEIQPNIHPDITVYEYKRGSESGYQEAFVIQRDPFVERTVPEEELDYISAFRKKLEAHLNDDIKAFLEGLQEKSNTKFWVDEIFTNGNAREFFYPTYWSILDSLHRTRLLKSSFSEEAFDSSETQFFVNNRWYLSNSLIHTLRTRISDESDLFSAFRLFWFHEAIHDHSHVLHSGNTEGIGRYPKIIEEADYQADVYAMLYEYGFNHVSKKSAVAFISKRIELAILTMWSFDDLNPGPRLQVRRIGRYLIWYFQLLRIEEYCESINDVLEALSEKPIIELRMVGITSPDKKRLELELTSYKNEDLAIGVFHENKFRSFAFNHGQLSLDRLMVGLKEHNHEQIKGVMRQLVHELFVR